MKKLKSILIFNSIIYWSIYLLKTFITWEIKNPFQWFLNIPTYTNDQRLALLMMIIIIIIVNICIAKVFLDKKGKWDIN